MVGVLLTGSQGRPPLCWGQEASGGGLAQPALLVLRPGLQGAVCAGPGPRPV